MKMSGFFRSLLGTSNQSSKLAATPQQKQVFSGQEDDPTFADPLKGSTSIKIQKNLKRSSILSRSVSIASTEQHSTINDEDDNVGDTCWRRRKKLRSVNESLATSLPLAVKICHQPANVAEKEAFAVSDDVFLEEGNSPKLSTVVSALNADVNAVTRGSLADNKYIEAYDTTDDRRGCGVHAVTSPIRSEAFHPPLQSVLSQSIDSVDAQYTEKYFDEHARFDSFFLRPVGVGRPSHSEGNMLWPINAPVQPVELTEAGFFYYGSEDRVQCAFCGIKLANWQPGDVPFDEHKKYSPQCDFIRARLSYSGTTSRMQVHNRSRNEHGGGYAVAASASSCSSATPIAQRAAYAARLSSSAPLPSLSARGRCNSDDGLNDLSDVCTGSPVRHAVGQDEVGIPSALVVERQLHSPSVSSANDSMQHYIFAAPISMSPPSSQQSNYSSNSSASSSQQSSASSATDDEETKQHNDERRLFRLGVLPNNPRKPEYATKEARLGSFLGSKWPIKRVTQQPEQLAEAGLYYTGRLDYVKCFFCGGRLRNWAPQDDVWFEHARWYPDCAFVHNVKGRHYVEAVKGREMLHALEAPSSSGDEVGTATINSATRRHGDAGLLCEQQQQQHCDDEAVQQLCNISALKIDQKEQKPSTTAPSCKICLDREVCIAFLPCGHLAACAHCAPVLQNCPICRTKILSTVRTYLV